MPNTSKGYNGSTDFLKWYKGNYGADYDKDTGLVRKEGMSDGDWDVGTILHNYYIKNQQNEADRQQKIDSINQRYDGMRDTAVAGFDSARRALGENKETAQQNASITYDKLKKYLPMKQRAQGLGGLGSESSALQAYNTYMTQMGGIASDYQENMRAIDTEETSNLGELERYRTDSLDEADTLYDNLGRSYADAADNEAKAAWDGYLKADKQKKDEAYQMAQSILGASTSGNLDELMTYVNGLAGKVSPEQLAALGELAKSVAETNYKKATDEQTNKQQSDWANNFNIAQRIIGASTSSSLEELMIYVNGLSGKVSPEQLAALGELAKSVAATNAKNAGDEQESGYNNAYNIALGVLQSSTTTNADDLLAYVNGLEGKVSSEQLAALQQIAQNVAGTNLKTKNDADQANANSIVETIVSGMLDAGNLEAAREYLENNKEFMGQSTYDAYSKLVDTYVKEEEKTKNEEEKTARDERIISGQENISYNGQQYRITGEYGGNANEVLSSEQLAMIKKANYSGPYDPSLPNGTTFAVNLGWSDGYITYYNGKWYESKNVGNVSTQDGNKTSNQSQASNDAPLQVGTPQGLSASDVIIKSHGVALDPAAQAGQALGNYISQMVNKDGTTDDDRNVGGGSFGNSGGGGGRGSSSHSHNSGTSKSDSGVLDAYINATAQPLDPAAQAGQIIGGWLSKYLQSLFKK